MSNPSDPNTSADSPIVAPRTISNSDALTVFNALFNNNQQAADAAAVKLKANWNKWATAFDAQSYTASENNAKVITGKKLGQEVENAKMKVAEAIKKALSGQQVSPPVTPPANPANNDSAIAAFYSIFKSPQIADTQVAKLVANWDKWANAFGGKGFDASATNAKVLAGRIIFKAMADARAKVAYAIQQGIDGKEVKVISDIPAGADNSGGGTNTPDKLEQAKDRSRVFQDFLNIEINKGAKAENPAFLTQGIQNSPYKDAIKQYAALLQQKPDGQTVVSYGNTVVLKGSNKQVTFTPYPKLGELSQIDKQGLDFLHEDIKEACVCVGSFVDGNMKAHWLGRNALSKGQFWSATKIIPMLNIVCRVNARFIDARVDYSLVRDKDGDKDDASFYDLAVDVVSYQENIGTSNAIAAMFKRFETYERLESWTKKITGNNNLEFRGLYGENPYINQPQLYDTAKSRVLLSAAPETDGGNNLLTTYDLTRFISMLGWHHYITQEARLPDAQWISLQTVVRAMGTDSARYADAALDKLGLAGAIASPVIISKRGNGYSDERGRTELVYVALVQFVDLRPKAQGKQAKLRTVAMALRGAKVLGDQDREAIELDARMAAEVTEILRRVVTEELA